MFGWHVEIVETRKRPRKPPWVYRAQGALGTLAALGALLLAWAIAAGFNL